MPKKILIVEDNPQNMKVELMALRPHGYILLQATDGEEALRLLLAEREFLREHLLTWLPGFCSQIREHDRLGLFRGLADLTEGWVSFDYQQHLPEMLRSTGHGQGN